VKKQAEPEKKKVFFTAKEDEQTNDRLIVVLD